MTKETLKNAITALYKVNPNGRFIWHGGEPLLTGLKTFNYIMRIQKKLNTDRRIKNSVVTNGTLLTKRFIRFFKKYDYHISLSLDGPQSFHDANRIYPDGSGTYERVMHSIKLLGQEGAISNVSCLTVLNKASISNEQDIYDFFNRLGLDFKINAVSLQSGDPLSITPKEYGRAMVRLYDLQMGNPGGIKCKNIDEFREGVQHGIVRSCENKQYCFNRVRGIEPDGTAYNCTRSIVHDDIILGNINETPLSTLIANPRLLTLKRNLKESGCDECHWLHTCNGGCGYEAYTAFGTLHSKTPLCEGRKMIFDHIASKEGAVTSIHLPF